VATAPPPKRVRRASDDVARELFGRIVRPVLVAVGALVAVGGVLIAPLPGPLGLPVTVVGLMLVLRNSFKARRQFVKFQHAYPQFAYPIRRLLRREPEFLPVIWQQTLRMERLILPHRWRFLVGLRRRLRGRRAVPA